MLYGIVGERLEQITRRVPLDEPPPLPENAKLKAIGKSIPRFDAVQKVTGRARYTFDVQFPGMLYARRVVSNVPHAHIKSIDTSAAEKYPGVCAVHVLERIRCSAQLRDPKAEAGNRYPTVRYAGQPFAAVAAETPRAAEAAARLVKMNTSRFRTSSRSRRRWRKVHRQFSLDRPSSRDRGRRRRSARPPAKRQRSWPRHRPAIRRAAGQRREGSRGGRCRGRS